MFYLFGEYQLILHYEAVRNSHTLLPFGSPSFPFFSSLPIE